MTYHFTELEKIKMWKFFKNRMPLLEIGQKFKCSWGTIRNILILTVGKEYTKITKKNNFKNHQEIGRKTGAKNLKEAWKNSSKIMISNSQQNSKKWIQAGLKSNASKYEKSFKKALEDENILFEWQEPINFPEGSYIKFTVVDFLIGNLIVEIDDVSHYYNPIRDLERDKICMNLGYTIFRFTHKELNNLKKCIKKIKTLI